MNLERNSIKLKLIFYSLLIILFSFAKSQDVKVALFYKKNVKEIIINLNTGKHIIFNELMELDLKNKTFLIQAVSDSIVQIITYDTIINSKKINILSQNFNSCLKVKVSELNNFETFYYGNFEITAKNGHLKIINTINLENYLQSIIESETGYHNILEMYKLQAILSRTYIIKNFWRHYDEGFNFCDDVHCQVYKGINLNFSSFTLIAQAINETKNLVITYNNKLIDAVYHANCGGETANSGQLWNVNKPYLKSIKDYYCVKSNNFKWETKIPLSNFNNFLSKYNTKIDNNFKFTQETRTKWLEVNNQKIPLNEIRQHFNLYSTFFNIKVINDTVIIYGKGKGHGVGLCQDGAKQQILEGFNYEQVIKYYYGKDVKIVNFTSLFK